MKTPIGSFQLCKLDPWLINYFCNFSTSAIKRYYKLRFGGFHVDIVCCTNFLSYLLTYLLTLSCITYLATYLHALRSRFSLPEHATYLSDCNFITRMLYKHCYSVFISSFHVFVNFYQLIIINVINNCCFTQLVNIDIFHETVSSLSQVLNFFFNFHSLHISIINVSTLHFVKCC